MICFYKLLGKGSDKDNPNFLDMSLHSFAAFSQPPEKSGLKLIKPVKKFILKLCSTGPKVDFSFKTGSNSRSHPFSATFLLSVVCFLTLLNSYEGGSFYD